MRGARGLAGTVAAILAAALLAGAPGPAAAAGDGHLCVGVVVDPTGSGSPRAPDTACALVPRGATGTDVLLARAKALNRPAPRFRDGLLCAIDGFPAAPACGDSTGGGGYAYWSYWTRSGSQPGWTYSNAGPDYRSPADGDVEGWAFQTGGREASRQPPLVPWSEVCAGHTLGEGGTASRSTPAAPPSPSPSPRSAASPRSTPPRPAPTRPSAPPSSPATAAATVTASAPRTPTNPPSAPVAGTAPVAATAPSPGGSPTAGPSAATGAGATGTVDAPVGSPATAASTPPAARPAVADPVTAAPSRGVGVGTLVGIGLVALLGGGAVVLARRRGGP